MNQLGRKNVFRIRGLDLPHQQRRVDGTSLCTRRSDLDLTGGRAESVLGETAMLGPEASGGLRLPSTCDILFQADIANSIWQCHL